MSSRYSLKSIFFQLFCPYNALKTHYCMKSACSSKCSAKNILKRGTVPKITKPAELRPRRLNYSFASRIVTLFIIKRISQNRPHIIFYSAVSPLCLQRMHFEKCGFYINNKKPGSIGSLRKSRALRLRSGYRFGYPFYLARIKACSFSPTIKQFT